MSTGSAPAQTQQTTQVKLPAWVEQASQENYNFAKDVAGRPLQQYGGPMVADPSQMYTQAYGQIGQLAGMPSSVTQQISNVGPDSISRATDPYFTQARDLFTKSAGPLDINAYLNPYTNEVEQRAIGNANTALAQQLRGVADQARKASAFGGSRAAVESGVTRGEGIRGIGDLSAQLRRQGFDVATSLAQGQQAGERAAAQGLLSTGGAVGGSRQANIEAELAAQRGQMAGETQTRSNLLQSIQALFGGGAQEQGQRQAVIDAAMKKFYEMRDYPVEQLNLRLAALGMSPYGRTETGTKIATGEDKGPDWASILLGVGGLGLQGAKMFGLSDRTAKTDIQKVSDGEIPLYAYRYKGDPKTYPKVVGPMAQDIEKKYPKAVKKFGGKRVIDINNLMEALA